jgi:hypothetical protein
MRRMYVAALASPLSVEYRLLDPVQHALAKDHAGGLYDFVHRDPALRDGERFRSVAALRRHCAEHDIAVAGDLHGVLGEKGPPRRGAGLRQGQAMGREALMEHARHRPGRRHPILALVSERGGGDKPPVLALAAALCRRGHAVHLLCDGDVADAVRPTDLPMLHLPSDRAQGVYCEPLYLARMAECGEAIGPDTPDPLRDWAEAVLPAALAVARPIAPRLLISTLFCMALADRLAPALNVPWAFVNPSFDFGEERAAPGRRTSPASARACSATGCCRSRAAPTSSCTPPTRASTHRPRRFRAATATSARCCQAKGAARAPHGSSTSRAIHGSS